MQHDGGGGDVGGGHAPLQLASDFHLADFGPAPTTRPFRARQQARQRYQHPSFSMAAFNGMTDEEMAEMQKRSNEYEPEATGPLVGQREPSTAITTEYALGDTDPVFQAKTRALPLKFSHYRKVRGDGRCGWRAIAFGYFEALMHLGDANKFLEEETRLRSLTNVVTSAGIELMLFEDFADEAYDLLRKCRQGLDTADAEALLIEAFNDESLQNYIITYLKTLTSSWMKSRPEEWAPWLLGRTVERYCDDEVMPTGSEIDNVSLVALKDVLLSPAGIALEVLYLDRSEGEEVNTHRMDPVTPGGFTVGTIRLLYRPGHYDMLYKAEDIPPSAPAMPTYLQYSSRTYHEPAYDVGISDFMLMIPGMSYAPPQACWSGSNYASSDFADAQSPVQQCSQASAPSPMTPIVQSQLQPQSVSTRAAPSSLAPAPNQIMQNMPIRPAPRSGLLHVSTTLQHQVAGGSPFRPSVWELEGDFMSAQSQLPFTTSIFRNSHFNTAHFLNPEFQPEEWRPDDEYITTPNKGTRHRTNG